MKKVTIFVIVLAAVILIAGAAMGATLTVGSGGTYSTIAAAITAAGSGDTILVAAGTYNENLTISKALTFLGANANIPWGSPSRGAESIVQDLTTSDLPVFTANADGITINGFEIIDPWANSAVDAGLSGFSNWNVKFNYIHNIGTSRGSSNVYAVRYLVGSTNTANVNISDNYISNVSNNTIALGHSGGIWFGQSTSTGIVSNLTIERNTVTNIQSALSNKNTWGISVGTGSNSTGYLQSPVIRYNVISNIVGRYAHAIGLEGKTPGAVVMYNIIDNISSPFTNPDAGGVVIQNNSGVGTITINYNSFTNLGYGVGNSMGTAVNAVGNWWGSAATPVPAGLVTYSPWLSIGTDADVSTLGFQPVLPMTWYTNTSVTLQSAIDAANGGDTLLATAGTYTVASSISISKGLILRGASYGIAGTPAARASETILSDTRTPSSDPGAFSISTTSPVVIDGITLQGSKIVGGQPANANLSFINNRWILAAMPNSGQTGMIYSTGCVITMDHNYIETTGFNASNSAMFQVAGGYAGSGTVDKMLITNNTFKGIPVWSPYNDGNGQSTLQLNFSGCQGTITGNTFDGADIGIIVANTSGNMTISGNTFTNLHRTAADLASGWYAAGILLYSPTFSGPVAISGNIFENSDCGIRSSNAGGAETGSNITISSNTFTGNSPYNVVHKYPTGTLTFGGDNSFDGVTLSSATLSGLYTIEDKILDAIDQTGFGFAVIKANNLYVTPNSYFTIGGTTAPSIQRALDAASSGNVINVAAGTYSEDVNVSKSIQLLGAGIDQSYIVGPKTGAAQTIFLGANNTTLDGFTITRDGNNTTDWASNVKTSGVAFGQTLTGCLVQNCKVTGNRNGVYLNNIQGATIKNNIITFNRTGVQLVNNVSNCLVENNTITNNWTMGFVLYYASNPMTATSNFVARNNDVSGNWYSQIESKAAPYSNSTSYDFRGNWWGAGTLNVTTTPAGEPGYTSQIPVEYGGSAVSPGTNDGKLTGALISLVNYDPWIGKATGIVVKSDSVNHVYNVANTNAHIVFTSLPPGTNATVTVQQTPAIPAGIPAPPPSAGGIAPLYLQLGATGLTNGTFTVTVTIDVSGIAGFSATTEVMYYSTASHSWVGISGTYNAGAHTYTFTTDHFTPFTFVNPLNPVNLYLTMDSVNTSKNIFYPHAIAGTLYGADDWSYSPMNDTIFVVPTGTQGIVAANFIIHYDATMASASAAAGNLFAGGAFNTSTPAAGQLLVQTANLSPGINVVPASGKYLARIIFTITKPGYNSIGIDDIDFRYFVAGPDTQAGVYVTTNPGAIKFYLGDFATSSVTTQGDGLINFNDLVPFSLAYWGESDGSPAGYKAKFDIGPTNTSGAYFAMPTPDGKVEFEDLVIFAIGYGKSGASQLPKQTAKPVTLALGSMQTTGGEVRVPIALSGTVSDVRALSMILNYSSTGLTFKGIEKAGEMNNDHSFMISKAENGTLMIDGAVLGLENNGLSHAGVIAYAVFTGKGTVGIESAKARSSANSAIEVKYDKGMMQSNAVPERYALAQNYPNPFNPATTIHYALAKAGHVEVVVYNMLGEVIATLVNSEQNAGYYDVTWNGQNDKHQTVASGIYLYRMRSGDFVDVQKMVLMK